MYIFLLTACLVLLSHNETPRGSHLISVIERDIFVPFEASESLLMQAAGKSQMYTACSDCITRNNALISFNFHPSENLM